MSHELFNTVCAKHFEISDNKKKTPMCMHL